MKRSGRMLTARDTSQTRLFDSRTFETSDDELVYIYELRLEDEELLISYFDEVPSKWSDVPGILGSEDIPEDSLIYAGFADGCDEACRSWPRAKCDGSPLSASESAAFRELWAKRQRDELSEDDADYQHYVLCAEVDPSPPSDLADDAEADDGITPWCSDNRYCNEVGPVRTAAQAFDTPAWYLGKHEAFDDELVYIRRIRFWPYFGARSKLVWEEPRRWADAMAELDPGSEPESVYFAFSFAQGPPVPFRVLVQRVADTCDSETRARLQRVWPRFRDREITYEEAVQEYAALCQSVAPCHLDAEDTVGILDFWEMNAYWP